MANVAYVPQAPTMAFRAVAVTKSDSTVYSPPLSGVWVGGLGDVAVIPAGQDSAVTFKAVPAGTLLPVVCSKVMSTNTSATDLVGLRSS